MTQLTKNFSLAELTASSTAAQRGISNEPTPTHMANLLRLAKTLQEVRDTINQPMLISSGYRSPALNKIVGGSNTSDHSNGLAADFTAPKFGSVRQVCEAIIASGIKFDQLIYEQGATSWVHLGIGKRMRQQVLSWSPSRGYVTGLVDL